MGWSFGIIQTVTVNYQRLNQCLSMSCSFPSFPLQFQPPTPSVTWSPHQLPDLPMHLGSQKRCSLTTACLGSHHDVTALDCKNCEHHWWSQRVWSSLTNRETLHSLGIGSSSFFFEIEIAWNHPPDNMFNRGKPNKHNDQANFGEWLVSDRMITLQRTLSKKN